MQRMRTSKAGLELIKSYEGFRARATRLPSGVWSIGYAHTKAAREGGRTTREDAEEILREYDLPRFEKAIDELVQAPLNQNEFDALASFVFNIGCKAFESSTVLTLLNAGERLAAAEAMSQWRKANLNGQLTVVDALVRRRAAEIALFLKDPRGTPVAPSGMVRPLNDQVSTQTGAARLPATKPLMIAPKSTPKPAAAEFSKPAPDRLTRMLGEPSSPKQQAEPQVSEPEIFSAGPTPDEITRAISALANSDAMASEPHPEPKRINDNKVEPIKTGMQDTEDLPDLPRAVMNGATTADLVIDDLEKVSVDPATVQQALRQAEADEAQDRAPRPGIIARVALGVTGLILTSFGLTKIATLGGQTVERGVPDLGQYFAYGSLVFGVTFFVIAAYLALRQNMDHTFKIH